MTDIQNYTKIVGMNKTINEEKLNSIKTFRMPRYQELPNVGLYLEQTAKYINGFLSPLGCMEITTSMISNYVKKKLIAGPVKKQYYADQIAYLFFIAIAKNVLSMEHIQLLFERQQKTYTNQVAYDYFCSELENHIFYLFGLKDTIDQIGSSSTSEKEMLKSVLISASHIIYLSCLFQSVHNESI